MILDPARLALFTLAGAVGGSFCATAVVRAGRSEQALRGRSRCDGCGAHLSFAATIPVGAFLWLRGHCRTCGARIDPIHFSGEVIGGAIVLTSISMTSFNQLSLWIAMGFILLVTALHDATTRRLPDALTVLVAGLGLSIAAIAPSPRLVEGLVSAVVAFALLEGVRRAGLVIRGRPAIGLGDVKLIAALALWLGAATSWMVVAASVLTLAAVLVIKPQDGRIAFGPAICAAAWVTGLALQVGWSPWP